MAADSGGWSKINELVDSLRRNPDKSKLTRTETFDLSWLLCLVATEEKVRFELYARYRR